MTAYPRNPCESIRAIRVIRDDRGLSSVEYVVLLVLVVAASVGLWQTFGSEVQDKVRIANAALANVTTGQGSGQTSGTSGNTAPASSSITTTAVVSPPPQPAPAPATEGASMKTKEDR
ncbi:MAG TPA: hypothetical protein VHC69_09140 [Polyangiaceae bacterium]|nr:hypothetical protein [Polyangiaceae bacterium]